MTTPTKTARVDDNDPRRVPESVQCHWRRRLRIARESTGNYQGSVPGLAPTTLGGFERRDMSTMTLANLRATAQTYGYTFIDFLKYLVGDDDEGLSSENRALIRGVNYLRSMNEEKQKTAADILRSLAEYEGEND